MSAVAITSILTNLGSVVVCGMIVAVSIAVIAGAGVAVCSGIGALLSAGCR